MVVEFCALVATTRVAKPIVVGSMVVVMDCNLTHTLCQADDGDGRSFAQYRSPTIREAMVYRLLYELLKCLWQHFVVVIRSFTELDWSRAFVNTMTELRVEVWSNRAFSFGYDTGFLQPELFAFAQAISHLIFNTSRLIHTGVRSFVGLH